jgi:hypothetical protein
MNELYAAEWDAARSGYDTGQLSSQGMDFENVRHNVIPNIVFIIHVLNASNFVRSYQILTLDAVEFIIASETINKSLCETNSTGCNYDRIDFFVFSPLAVGIPSCSIFFTPCAAIKKY